MTSAIKTAQPDHWRNFLWALSAPDITSDYPLPWLPESRRLTLNAFFAQPDTRTRLEPELLSHLQTLRSRRLGIYFESLWAFAFRHHPDYALLAHNFPIRDQGKTLGELDFVVRHTPDNAVEHWEIALKYYLQVGDYWIGPGLRDRLDIKLARMRDHQLPIAKQATATSRLHASGIRLDRQWAIMPGRRFTPRGQDHDILSGAVTGWWTDLATFTDNCAATDDSQPREWFLLPKSCWLAPLDGTAVASAPPGEPLTEFHLVRGPVCVAACTETGELHRGFVVPSDWPSRARQSLLPPSDS